MTTVTVALRRKHKVMLSSEMYDSIQVHDAEGVEIWQDHIEDCTKGAEG